MSNDNDVAISVEGVHKFFRLPHERHSSVKSVFINIFRSRRTYEKQQALNDISFEIKKGEFFGIVGRNGSGKSTLLKLLAGIYCPNKGAIRVNGKLTPFIELGVGFNQELTGRENVYLNGALLGFDRKDMDEMYKDIVEFAELERFMDQKLKNYSSGMQVRLAFSIAIRAKSDILLIDEVLAVGDTAFQKKCFEYFVKLKEQKKTVILVTHDMSAVEKFCDKALVIHDGDIVGEFSPTDAGMEYDKLNSSAISQKPTEKTRWGTGKISVQKVEILNESNKKKTLFETGKQLNIRILLHNPKNIEYTVGLSFEDMYGVTIAGPNSVGYSSGTTDKVIYQIDKLPFVPGEYKLTVAIFDQDVIEEFDHLEKQYKFDVTSTKHDLYGKVDLAGKWTFNG